MTKIIGASTLDDALAALTETVRAFEARGETTLVFCEDRLTLLAEQAVVGANGATFLTEVSTFRRFLKRTGERSTIGKHGSVLVTAALLGKLENALGCFRRNAAQAVYETLAQLAASSITEELLASAADEVDGILRHKIEDLALLLGRYNDFLKEHDLVDENGYLALLPGRIEALPPRNIVFFAFPSFTRQAQACIRAAISCHHVTGIFLAGSEPFYVPEAMRAFRRVAEECGQTVVTQMPSSLRGDALTLSKALYAVARPQGKIKAPHIHTHAQRAVPGKSLPPPCDETEEMNEIAARIRKLVSEGRRYRDIAVLVGGEEYLLAVRKAFAAYEIPYYADVKRKFSEHPFCTFALSLLEAAADGLLPDEADAIAASVYFGESGAYRNYLRRYGAFRGGALREVFKDADAVYGSIDSLEACRTRMKTVYELFRAHGRRAKGREYTAAIRALWTAVDGEKTTEELAARLREEDKPFLDISRLGPMLDETDRVVGDEVYDAREFAAILRSGMDALTVSILPRRADAVFVGDATESRIPRTPVLFVAGLTDSLPRVVQDTAVISDGEIKALSRLQMELDPEIAVVNARAKEAFCLNLCAFRDELYLSCPVRKGGEEAARSEIFYYIERTLEVAPMSEIYPYDRCAYAPALLAFFSDLDAAGEGEERIRRFSSVRAVLKERGETDPDLLRARREKPVSAHAGALWTASGGTISPTRFESWFDCPYKGFAFRALRITENEERTLLDNLDAGVFLHDVLQRVAPSFNGTDSEEDVRTAAESTARMLIREPRYAAVADTKAGLYASERLIEDAVTVAAAAFRQLKGSLYAVKETEYQVSIPALGIGGKTDRIDTSDRFVRIIDYKSGSIGQSAAEYTVNYYTGRKLQLPLYLRAASETELDGKRHTAAGAFYFPAADTFKKEGSETGRFRMIGWFCLDDEVLKTMDTSLGSKTGSKTASDLFVSGSASTALPRDSFEDFLDYAGLVTAQAKREMAAGDITPSPYGKACGSCKLKGMCGFVGDPREERAIPMDKIADIVRCEREKEGKK